MPEIKTISDQSRFNFDKDVQEFLDKGYKVHSLNCDVISYCDGYSETIYQAILLKED